MSARNARTTACVRAMPGTLGSLAGRELGVAERHRPCRRARRSSLFGPPPRRRSGPPLPNGARREGVLVWDNDWYARPLPAPRLQPPLLLPGAASRERVARLVSVAIAAAALFASLAEREWGDARAGPARVFAVLACGPLFTGTYPYALGLAVALGALKALQARRGHGSPVLLAVLTAGLRRSPSSILCLACVAAFLAGGRASTADAVAMGAALLAVGLLQGSLLLVYRYEAEYPFFRLSELLASISLCARLRRARPARRSAVGPSPSSSGCGRSAQRRRYLVPSPIGENVTRLRGDRAPARAAGGGNRLVPAPLALRRRDHRRACLHASALRRSGGPTAATRAPRRRPSGRRRSPSWPSRPSPGDRVEVVPTGDHWEAYWVPRAGFPLARGWYRQLDIAENPLFYEDTLARPPTSRWLHSLGVRFVLLPDTQLGRVGEGREADLVRSGRAGLDRGRPRRPGDRLRGARCRARSSPAPGPAGDRARARSRRRRAHGGWDASPRRPLDADVARAPGSTSASRRLQTG